MDVDFENILAESFNNAYYNNNIPISTTEANNVNDIFVGNEVKTECIICYEEQVPCIKCFQCTALYCKICLTKIASESNKCICAIQIKSNYSKLKQYNQDLIKKAREEQEKKKKEQSNKNTQKLNTNNTNINNNNNTNLNSINNNNNNSINTNNSSNSSNTNLNIKLEFLKDLTNNNIYNINFKSFKTEYGENIPNFDYLWDYTNKKLIFYAVPNYNQEINNIEINYNILNAEFQAEIYVWILQLLNLPFNKFMQTWNKIAKLMPTITSNNKTLIVSNIVHMCKI